jgi:methylenetetrahydromethanopterin dehydrogenase
VELALDEIAERGEIDVRVLGFGAKMTKKEAEESSELKGWGPDLVVIIGPNSALPGPTTAREIFREFPTIVISDGPTKKDARDAIAEAGFGYIILPVDPLIGAKREFLDPAEMAIFNSDALKGETKLPKILATPEVCTARMNFKNPYAEAKALGALHMAQTVAAIDAQACFKLKELEKIALFAGAGHEVMRAAAKLADEAREIEKACDSVSRKPHARSGEILSKSRLFEKPVRPESR